MDKIKEMCCGNCGMPEKGIVLNRCNSCGYCGPRMTVADYDKEATARHGISVPYYTTENRYERKHSDFKGVFENLQGHAECNHLIGKRSLMIQGCALIIESAGLEIIPSWEHDMVTKGGKIAKYSYTDDWSRPVFDLELNSGRIIQVVFLEEGIYEGKPMHSLTGEGEPDSPLREEYQVKAV